MGPRQGSEDDKGSCDRAHQRRRPCGTEIRAAERSYDRWRRASGGLKTDRARRLKELEGENARLRKAVAALALDKLSLKEAASGNAAAPPAAGPAACWGSTGRPGAGRRVLRRTRRPRRRRASCRRAASDATAIDEFPRESLAIMVARRRSGDDMPAALTGRFIARGPPGHVRSDQGPECIALVVKERLGRLGVGTLDIEKAGPWENG